MSAKAAEGRHFLRLAELTPGGFGDLLDSAREFSRTKHRPAPGGEAGTVAFVSERRSVRTRVAAFAGARLVGAECLDLPWEMFYADPVRRPDHASFVAHELRSLADLGCSALVARVLRHGLLELWRSVDALPVINACSDVEHPLQALADALTLSDEFGGLNDVRLTFVGNGASPVFGSLLELSRLAGLNLRVVTPPGYKPAVDAVRAAGLDPADVCSHDLSAGLGGADAVYADESFYREPTAEERAAFAPYRISEELLSSHCPDARMMHCLPHGDEVDGAVLERPGSLVSGQVRNRPAVTAAVLARAIRTRV